MEQNIPHSAQMFHLPIEVSVYVPSTKDVDKVISRSEMQQRINEVKEFLAKLFGGYSSSPIEGGFMSSDNKLVYEKVEKVTSFAPKEAFEEHKEQLVTQCSIWAQKWGQEAIGLEHEGDLYYVPQKFEHGGSLEPTDALQMAMNQATRISHHVEEVKEILAKKPKLEAWVIAKLESASNDLENVTHYLDGLTQMKKLMAVGGNIDNQMVDVKINYIEQKNYAKEKTISIPNSEIENYQETQKLSPEIVNELLSKFNEKDLAETNIISVTLKDSENNVIEKKVISEEEFAKGGSVSEKQESKIGKVMREFKEGKLHSSSGDLVTDRKQAIAIALSEAGVPKKEEGGLVNDPMEDFKNFDFSSLFSNDEPVTPIKDESDYNSEKIASIQSEIDNQILTIERQIKDWESRVYKNNKNVIYTDDNDIHGDALTIDFINESKRRKKVQTLSNELESLLKAKSIITNYNIFREGNLTENILKDFNNEDYIKKGKKMSSKEQMILDDAYDRLITLLKIYDKETPINKSNSQFEEGGSLSSDGWNNDYENDPMKKFFDKAKEKAILAKRAGLAYLTKGKSEMGNMPVPNQNMEQKF
jgi:hypothetical protein